MNNVLEKAKLDYYKYDKLYSYNGTFNFLVGGRGLGKTFGAKKKAVKDALTKGRQFIYMRRYKDELAISRDSFFADLIAKGLFPEWEFKFIGMKAVAAPKSTQHDKKRPWQVIGYFIPLSIAQSVKSVSFPNVYTIIFDEFIIEKGKTQYLPNEAVAFQNFYSTVDRNEDRVKVFFLANSVSMMNPYFLAYKIRPDEGNEFVVLYDGFVVAHFPEAANFRDGVMATAFGRFISGTEYADYAVGNQFADNNENLIGMKLPDAKYMYSLECKTGTFSVWYSVRTNEYFIQSKLPGNQKLFTLVPDKMDSGKTLVTFSDRLLGMLRTAFRQGMIWFDEPTTRNTFTEIFKR